MAKGIVLGATSAIAIAVSRELAARGDELLLVGRNGERLNQVASDLRARGSPRVEVAVHDLCILSDHSEMLQRAREKLGAFDFALLAHGTLPDQKRCEESVDALQKALCENAISQMSLLTLLANDFEKQRSGVLIVISSVAGDRGRQSNYAYGAAKGALTLFCQGLRNRLYPVGVRVITVKPGFVDTPMTAHLKKGILFAKPEVIAKGIVRALNGKGDQIYLPWFWWPIMEIIRHIPEAIFKRLKL